MKKEKNWNGNYDAEIEEMIAVCPTCTGQRTIAKGARELTGIKKDNRLLKDKK